jgi:hypothetical protein
MVPRPTTIVEMTEDWVVQDVIPYFTPLIVYDKEDPPMTIGSIYSSITVFKVALSQHAMKNERKFDHKKSGPDRVRVHCAKEALQALVANMKAKKRGPQRKQ